VILASGPGGLRSDLDAIVIPTSACSSNWGQEEERERRLVESKLGAEIQLLQLMMHYIWELLW